MPETQEQIKSFVRLCSYYGNFTHNFSDCAAAPPKDMCRNNLLGNVVHTEATTNALETLKFHMFFAPVLLISKMGHDRC